MTWSPPSAPGRRFTSRPGEKFDIKKGRLGRLTDKSDDVCSEGAEEVALLLLNSGAAPRARATSDWSPLHFSAREGHTNICRLMVSKGAKVNAVTSGGWTPLMLAAGFNRVETTRYLISAGANRWDRRAMVVTV